jgi:hypothetical protein
MILSTKLCILKGFLHEQPPALVPSEPRRRREPQERDDLRPIYIALMPEIVVPSIVVRSCHIAQTTAFDEGGR